MVDQKEKSFKRSQQRGDQDSVCLFNEFWHTVVVYYYGRHGWIRRDFILWGHSSVLAFCPLVILWARTWVSPLREPSLDDLEAFLWTEAIVREITQSSRLTCGNVGLLGHLVLLLLVPVVSLPFLHLPHLCRCVVSLSRVESRRRLWRGCRLQQRLGSSGSLLAADANTKLTSLPPPLH